MKTTISFLVLLIFTVVQSFAQLSPNFNSEYGVSDALKPEADLKLKIDNFLSNETKAFLLSKKLPVTDINPVYAYRLKKQCCDEVTVCQKKIEELLILRGVDFSKYTAAGAVNYDLLKLTEKLTNLTVAEITSLRTATDDQYNKKANELEAAKRMYKEASLYYETINSMTGNPKLFRRFFPLRNAANADFFYFGSDGESKINFIQDVMFQRNFDGSNSVNAEVISGVLPFPRIPIKMSIGSTITQVNEDVESEGKAANKIPYGGYLNVSFTYPLFFSNTRVGRKHNLIFYVPLESRFNVDEVSNGQQLDQTYYFNEFSASFLMSIDMIQSTKAEESVSVFLAVRNSLFMGGDEFQNELGVDKFSLLQINGGLKWSKRFTVAFIVPVKSSENSVFQNQSASISLKFEPNK